MGLREKYYFCIPEKVLNDLLVIVELGKPEIPGFKKSYLLEILTLISLHIHKDKGETPLKMQYLCKLIWNAGRDYLPFLINWGVIKRSTNYKPGVFSYSYSFTSEYQSKYQAFPVTDNFLIRRLEKINLKHNVTHKYPGQNKFIRKITIDPKAFDFIQSIEDMKKYNHALSAILKIYHGDIFYTIDPTSGRYHSNLTNLPSSLRQFIRIEGKRLSNIDVKNSQPYFFSLLLTDPGKVAHLAKNEKFSLLVKSLQPIHSLDVTMWFFLVKSGNLYRFFWEKLRERELMKSYSIYDEVTKKKVKEKLFVIFYGRTKLWSPVHQCFYDTFPNVYERIVCLKGFDKGNKFKSFKRLAILLQTIESHVILNIILPKINKKHPETIAVTIHDSIMTSTDDINRVRNIMDQELTKFVGDKPTLKTENSDFSDFSLQNLIKVNINNKERERGSQGEGVYYYDGENPVIN